MNVGIAILNTGLTLLLAALAWWLPDLSRPTLPFGVRIPAEHVGTTFILDRRRRYRGRVLSATVPVLAAQLVLAAVRPEIVRFAWPALLVLVLAAGAYYVEHRRIRQVKRDHGWFRAVRTAAVVDTSLRTEPEPFPWLWALPSVLVLAGTALLGALWYPAMPETIVMHWSDSGQADRTVDKSVPAVFTPVFVQVGLTALIVLLTRLSMRAKPELDPAQPRKSARQHRRFTRRSAKALLLFTGCVNLTMLGVGIMTWSGEFSALWLLVSLAPVLLGVVGLLVLSARIGQGGASLADPADETDNEDTGLTQRDDDRYWRMAGTFYVNPDDSAVLVPKRVGFGWTVNMASRRGQLLLTAMLGIPVAAVLLPLLLG